MTQIVCTAVASSYRVLRYTSDHTVLPVAEWLQSYYGAALCVCWSPDAVFVASGGEDDLVAVYSVADRQVRIAAQVGLHCISGAHQ